MPAAKAGRKKGQKNKSPPYSLQLVQTILDASLEEGENIKSAAQAQGVPYSTLWGWIGRHPEAKQAWEANHTTRITESRKAWVGGNAPASLGIDKLHNALTLIKTEGLTLTQAAKRIGERTGTLWEAIHKKNLLDDYRLAMQAGSHALAESTIDILDDDSGDLIEQPDGRLTVNTARVRRDQARASQRMVLAARANPEYYGPPAQARAPSITINIDSDKLQRIRDVSAQTLEQIGKDKDGSDSSNS